ncbi:major facilitator superfamily domain-containing protein [Rhodocollybia butyracea]|uniref:Major facilitator superfamily domain-containing protein n=1 Tax=Rhodocollybia butyracea TaxID=206335 RepID=A0A9P5U7X3_9AGAR|nr:major facilitator superfamily domain-containing protein [Rhodocollybia butyracea]
MSVSHAEDILPSRIKDIPGLSSRLSQLKEQESQQQNNNVGGPTDGGMDAWMTIAGCFMVQFCTVGYSNAFGVYQDIYTRDFLSNKSPSDISWIGSFQYFMQYAPGVLVGYAFDAGYFRHMIIMGSFLEVFSMFMLSLVRKEQYYQVFLAQAVGIGLGQGLLFIPSLTIISQHFKKRRSFAIGIAVTGASVGGIIWPILLNQLDQKTTLANANRAAGGLAGVLLLCAIILMKPKPVASRPLTSPQLGVKSVLGDVPFMISIGAASLVSLGLFFPYFFLQLYAVDRGIPPHLAFYTLAILNAGGIAGRLVPNFFADRLGPYNMIIPCLSFTAVLLLVGLVVRSFAGLVVFSLAYGFTSGSYISLIPSIIGQLSRKSGQPGLRMGFAFTNVGFWMLIGTPIEGALLHPPHSHDSLVWYPCIIFSAVAVALGASCMLVSRIFFVREGRNGEQGQLI